MEDFLSRRTRSLLLDARASIEIAEPVAKLMAKDLDRNKSWIREQVADYKSLAEGYLIQ